jgi:two-component system cell cycle sensor histidine kinase PleC
MEHADSQAEDLARALAQPVRPAPPHATTASVLQRFSDDADLLSIPVVAGDRPVGLVNRWDLTIQLSTEYGRALFARKPISLVMDPHPLLIACDEPLDVLRERIMFERPAALTRGFIVTEQDAYYGIGTPLSLLSLSVHQARRRAAALAKAQAEAEAASRAKSAFLANISHELRTPLNAVIGYADFIRGEGLGPVGNPEYLDHARAIAEGGQHLLSIVNDLVDMARIEAGRVALVEETVDLRWCVDLALRLVRPQAERRRVQLQWDPQADIPCLLGDARALRQIVLNVVGNAVKFTPDGGDIDVRVELDRFGGVAIVVTDTGIGIPSSRLKEITKPFVQAANALDRNVDGIGLGLAIVDGLMRLHDGAMTLESELGSGTRVRLEFPPARVRPAQEARRA